MDLPSDCEDFELGVEAERWRLYADDVWISSWGRVNRDKMYMPFYPCIARRGYRRVMVRGNTTWVHNMVAEAFIGPRPTPNHSVDHADRDRSNNSLSNLSWATKKQQVANQKKRAAQDRDYSIIPVLPGEVWKKVGHFSVSSYGRLKLKTLPWMPKTIGMMEYPMFGDKLVHRIVADQFLPPPPSSSHTIDHINRNKEDNRVENLRWATRKEQIANTVRVMPNSALKKPVRGWIGGKWVYFDSAAKAEAETGCSNQNIAHVCKGRRSKTLGIVWEYV